LRTLVSKLDSARSKGVLTRNAVSRKKSRMMKLYNVSFAAAAN
ncbi:MAG: 30S ribosomal protein S20, partial [Treponemataceae bacterium]|nr:30S ribosomal protein S20 [Treponemataceae bacterium]